MSYANEGLPYLFSSKSPFLTNAKSKPNHPNGIKVTKLHQPESPTSCKRLAVTAKLGIKNNRQKIAAALGMNVNVISPTMD